MTILAKNLRASTAATRRNFITGAPWAVAAASSAMATAEAHERADRPLPSPAPTMINVVGYHRADAAGNIVLVHRDQVPEVLAGPQPVPTEVRAEEDDDGDGIYLLRIWESMAAVKHCRLCPTCGAHERPIEDESGTRDRVVACAVGVPLGLTYGELAMYRINALGADGTVFLPSDLDTDPEWVITNRGLELPETIVDLGQVDPDEAVTVAGLVASSEAWRLAADRA